MRNTKRTLVIVDDDESLCESLTEYLAGHGLTVLSARTGDDALKLCSRRRVDVVLLDQRLPDASGYNLCASFLGFNEQTKIIFMTAYPSFDNALMAIKEGAHDYLSKPFDLKELKLTIERALRTLELERVEQLQQYRESRESNDVSLIGDSPAFRQVTDLIGLSASSDATALILGETGTGKNVVAKAMHYRNASPRKSFVSLNCAALPENLIEAELFGYEMGAFTGATAAKRGVFEMAEGGTIFLDEIGELQPHLQSKLLSVLDEKTIKRIGGETPRAVDVRIIAATNIDLPRAIREKKFREDLYYRLSVICIHIPPLRKRKEDLPGLCAHLIEKLGGGDFITLPESEIAALMKYDWPGNVRELRNIIERALILRTESVINPSSLLGYPSDSAPSPALRSAAFRHGGEEDLTTLRDVEKKYISNALDRLSRNYSKTARTLGISLSTLKRKIQEYDIN
jgi:DNA-binding NtrC family response regulator